ncbi:E3 ubiquitin-protein ligase TRIM39-like [Rhinatrema bivittatum]|uniref:E3 ubiquitin-protein ligase TRIM39-like n=1 Tax=Rhinatrema bivittatum TaxID=194408 RepID=UPI001129889A|nr:E3 ubiquitin-protein ligase TRIM39-like [Rhinatrema bivittatum]
MPGRSSVMETLFADLTCPVCLEYFTDPVTLGCGHNFCRSCISRCWERPGSCFFCPVCRQNCPRRSLEGNRQLGEAVQRLCTQPAQTCPGCQCTNRQHETFKLFCREDESILCMVCNRSQEHRSHNMISIEEAEQEYKEKLQRLLDPMRQTIEDLQRLRCEEELKSRALKNKVESEKRKVTGEFARLRQLLDEQEKILISRLEAVDKKISRTESRTASRLSTETSFLRKLIRETEETCQKPATDFLKSVKSTIRRCETVKLPKLNVPGPAGRSKALIQVPPQDSGQSFPTDLLKEIRQHFKEDVTLDENTANPYLIVYDDGKKVKRCDTKQEDLPDNPERFDTDPCVLGCEGFTSGRHYWEVEVEHGRYWAVGAANASVRRKGGIRATPEEGIWTVGLYWSQYRALTSCVTHLSLSQGLRKVGLFLDYELGQISFFNAECMEHVYTFHHRFTEKVFPLIWVWSTETRIKLNP